MEEITNGIIDLYLQSGITAVVVIAFFIVLGWVLKENSKREKIMRDDSIERERLIKEENIIREKSLKEEIVIIREESKERENKLMLVIETISKDMPEIKEKLDEMSKKVERISDKIQDINLKIK